jgi:hypothetical protein
MHERKNFALHASSIVSHRCCPLKLDPLRTEKRGRQYNDDAIALVNRPLQGEHKIIAPLDRLFVEETAHAIAHKPPVQFANERLIDRAVTEKDGSHARCPRVIDMIFSGRLESRAGIADNRCDVPSLSTTGPGLCIAIVPEKAGSRHHQNRFHPRDVFVRLANAHCRSRHGVE